MSSMFRLFSPSFRQQSCSMATIKEIAVRLKSVKNIQKITGSMKMVAASKFARAEKDLRSAKVYGHGAQLFYKNSGLLGDTIEILPNSLIIALTSDRGLCGSAHSNISKSIISRLNKNPELKSNCKLILIGDKSRQLFLRQYRNMILTTFSNVGKKSTTFEDAAAITGSILSADTQFEHGIMFYNKYISAVSYKTVLQPIFGLKELSSSEPLNLYDSVDEPILEAYNEFLLTSLIYAALREASASEHSSRMTAMASATKNAGEMMEKLSMTYNRTRQAAITRELTEIISGAAAVQ